MIEVWFNNDIVGGLPSTILNNKVHEHIDVLKMEMRW